MDLIESLWDFLKNDALTTVAAFGSLAIGVYVLSRQVWSERKAHIEVRYEEASLTPHFGNSITNTEIDYRVVIVNHGPSVAKDVGLVVFRNDGRPIEPFNVVDVASDADPRHVPLSPLPIPRLHAGQTYHLPFMTAVGNRPYAASLTWKDGRVGKQTREIWLSRMRS